MSQSPHLSFNPLDPGLHVAAGGSQSTNPRYKTYDVGWTGGQRAEGVGREEASGVGHEGTDDQGTHEPCQQPPTQQSGTQIEGTATGPSATKRAWHASEACSDPKGSKRLKTQVVQPHTHFAATHTLLLDFAHTLCCSTLLLVCLATLRAFGVG